MLLEVERICRAMDKSGMAYELLAVDDGSTDETLARLRLAEPDFPSLRVIHFTRNGGAGTVRRIGTQQARGEIVVWTDADLTYPNERIPELIGMLESVVVAEGATGKRAAIPGYRVAGKTGTAWKATAGGYSTDRYMAVFGGMAPATHPRLAAVVVIDEPSAGQHMGGDVAAPVFSAVVGHALRLLAVAPDEPVRALPDSEPAAAVRGIRTAALK